MLVFAFQIEEEPAGGRRDTATISVEQSQEQRQGANIIAALTQNNAFSSAGLDVATRDALMALPRDLVADLARLAHENRNNPDEFSREIRARAGLTEPLREAFIAMQADLAEAYSSSGVSEGFARGDAVTVRERAEGASEMAIQDGVEAGARRITIQEMLRREEVPQERINQVFADREMPLAIQAGDLKLVEEVMRRHRIDFDANEYRRIHEEFSRRNIESTAGRAGLDSEVVRRALEESAVLRTETELQEVYRERERRHSGGGRSSRDEEIMKAVISLNLLVAKSMNDFITDVMPVVIKRTHSMILDRRSDLSEEEARAIDHEAQAARTAMRNAEERGLELDGNPEFEEIVRRHISEAAERLQQSVGADQVEALRELVRERDGSEMNLHTAPRKSSCRCSAHTGMQ